MPGERSSAAARNCETKSRASRAGPLDRRLVPPFPCRVPHRRRVPAPRRLVEVERGEADRLVGEHRIRAHRERLARVVPAPEMPGHRAVRHRDERPLGTRRAPHLRLAAHPADPFVAAHRLVAGFARPAALEAPREHVLASPEEPPEQRHFRLRGRCHRDRRLPQNTIRSIHPAILPRFRSPETLFLAPWIERSVKNGNR